MLASLGFFLMLCGMYSLSVQFTLGGLGWFVLGVALMIPNFIHLVVVDRFNGNPRK
jgi:hypothetical protein